MMPSFACLSLCALLSLFLAWKAWKLELNHKACSFEETKNRRTKRRGEQVHTKPTLRCFASPSPEKKKERTFSFKEKKKIYLLVLPAASALREFPKRTWTSSTGRYPCTWPDGARECEPKGPHPATRALPAAAFEVAARRGEAEAATSPLRCGRCSWRRAPSGFPPFRSTCRLSRQSVSISTHTQDATRTRKKARETKKSFFFFLERESE